MAEKREVKGMASRPLGRRYCWNEGVEKKVQTVLINKASKVLAHTKFDICSL